jgi:uncharacterized membrane protein/nitrite reductase/ring-hydroxylating ferredoxin subunit
MRSRAQFRSHPLHPMLIAFPIGLWVTSLAFDLFGVALRDPALWSAGFYTAVGGCVGAALAAVPGVIDLFSVVPPKSSAKARGLIHGGVNTLVLIIFVAELVYRAQPETQPDRIALLASVIGLCLLAYSGWLGGTLVYRNQIGVDHRYASAGKWRERTLKDWEQPVCNSSELADGQMILATIAGKRIVVGKCSEGIVAFADRCTHKGGSLADGTLIGCAVQCPWHGSQFNVSNGHVITGPAERAIATYTTRITGGEVFVEPAKSPKKKAA